MAKKKAKKKAARKAVPRKKAAAKKVSRKTTAKKTRKPARKVTRTSAAKKKTRSPHRKPSQAGGTTPFSVDVRNCSINPPSQNFAPFASVTFACSQDCVVVFSNPSIFGFPGPDVSMHQGDNQYQLVVAVGQSSANIKGCKIMTGPADIIVP